MHHKIPIIDLFAGPGGLGEGFSAFSVPDRGDPFEIALSIEKEPNAHRTLTLRAFFRQFPAGKAPEAYYEYLRAIDEPEAARRKRLFEVYPRAVPPGWSDDAGLLHQESKLLVLADYLTMIFQINRMWAA